MNVVILGASGTAGGSVLKVCLRSPAVESVRAITRRPLSADSDKLRVFMHGDYLNYEAVSEAYTEVESCFYCLGISTTQVSGEQEYRRITHDFAVAAAQMLKVKSPAAVFHFISGQGTRPDSRFMWARVKAETERDIMSITDTVCWRPSFIDGEPSAGSPKLYRILRPLGRLLKPFPDLYVTGGDIGKAMLQATKDNVRGRIIENAEIRAMARRG